MSSIKYMRRGRIYPSNTISYFRTCWTNKSWKILAGVLIFTISIVFFHIGWDFPIIIQHGFIFYPILFCLAFFYTIANYLFAALHDPGVIPRPNADETLRLEKEHNIQADLAGNYFPTRPPPITITVRNEPHTSPFCYTCRIYRLPHVVHCSVCDACIEHFDHHCPWINNCVGLLNYRYFSNFVLSCSVLCFIGFIGCVLAAYFRWDIYKYQGGLFFAYNIPNFLIGLLTILLGFTLSSFWCFHCQLAMSGETTRDNMRTQEHRNPDKLKHALRCKNLLRSWCGPVRPSVDWNQLYEKDHYIEQEKIYKKIRPTLLSNTLKVPKRYIQGHIQSLIAKNYFGITQQVQGFNQTRKTRKQDSSMVAVDVIDHLPMHAIEINQIDNNPVNIRYLLIEAVHPTNITTFWNIIWTRNVLSIVMLYDLNENNSFCQYWPDERNPSMKIDDCCQVDFIRTIQRNDIGKFQFTIQKIDGTESHMVEIFQIKNWNDTKFSMDPINLLSLQYSIEKKEKEDNFRTAHPGVIVLHTAEINTRTFAYMTIDTNRYLLSKYNYINILNTIVQLDEQLPISLANDYALITIYMVILHHSGWIYPSDLTTILNASFHVDRALRTNTSGYFHQSMSDLFQNFTTNSLKIVRSIIPWTTENPYQPVAIDCNVVYCFDSYIHSKAFLLTVGHNYNTLFKTISIFKIRHFFLFQQNSHLDTGFIAAENLKLDSNFTSIDFRRYQKDDSTVSIYIPINSIGNILLYRFSELLVEFDQNNDGPILICIDDVKIGAIVYLLANLMQQFNIDKIIDIFHQARKISYSCPAFRIEDDYRDVYECIKLWLNNEVKKQLK